MDPLWIILGVALLLLVLGVLYVVGAQQQAIKQVARAAKVVTKPKQAKESKKDQSAPKQQKAKPAAKQEKKQSEKKVDENVEVKAEKEKPKQKKEKQPQAAPVPAQAASQPQQTQPAQTGSQPQAGQAKKDKQNKEKKPKAVEPELPANETHDLLSLHARSTKQQQVGKSEDNLTTRQAPSEAQQAGWKVAGSINADVNAMKKNLADKEDELRKAHSQTQVVERQLRDQKAAFTKLEKQKQEAEKQFKQQIEKLEAELKGKPQGQEQGHGRHSTASPAQARRDTKTNPWSPHLADEIQSALKNAHQLKEDIEAAVADHNARLGKGGKKATSSQTTEEKGKEPATEEGNDEVQEETASS